ncbi:DNA-binding transcriptional regulator [Frankia sp. R82]|uniref:helix-turn-helix domain-containing protein n=1 Tax=Frankia sp. R82 TaxID=2950553 RepID=UPI00204315DB|nr:helix-turn-helix domain-containing protein [Frankia sp. R82]MCM3886827.1 hypothetical protein [Frankia sp. R82]
MAVTRWSGRETRALREARRMSVRAFAAHLGVAVASVSNWERRGTGIRLRDETLEILDRDLDLASEDVRVRFDAALTTAAPPEMILGRPDDGLPAGTEPMEGESTADVLRRVQRRSQGPDADTIRELMTTF